MATRSLNKVLLIGNLTRDPEMRYTAKGTPVCVFGVATNRSWKDSTTGDIKEEAEFINIVAWSKLAEICYNLLSKGMLVWIEGEIRTRAYENAEGVTIHRTEVHANDVLLLNDKGRIGKGHSGSAADGSQDNGDVSKGASEDKAEAKTDDAAPAEAKKSSKKKEKVETVEKTEKVTTEEASNADKILDDDLIF